MESYQQVVLLPTSSGFPPLHPDEGHYMRRAMQVLKGMGPQESVSTYPHPYDHPYFGQLFLAASLGLILQ